MYISGKNSCLEILKKNIKVNEVLIADYFKDDFIISELKKNKISFKKVDKSVLDKLVFKNHQGIILNIDDYQYCDLDDITNKNSLVVILDHLEDPHNLGAIIRTCVAFSVDGIIIPKDRSAQVNETVIKTSAGAVFHAKIVQVANLVNTIKHLKKENFWIVGTDMEGTNLDKIDYQGNVAIVVGNEGKGMSRLVKEHCDYIAKIPIENQINSLNASVATGIVIYEAVRRR